MAKAPKEPPFWQGLPIIGWHQTGTRNSWADMELSRMPEDFGGLDVYEINQMISRR